MDRAILACRALSDPLAIRILLLLVRREMTMSQLQMVTDRGRSAVNNRLEKLRMAGLADGERDARRLVFAISPAGRRMTETLQEIFGEELAWDPSVAADSAQARRDLGSALDPVTVE